VAQLIENTPGSTVTRDDTIPTLGKEN